MNQLNAMHTESELAGVELPKKMKVKVKKVKKKNSFN